MEITLIYNRILNTFHVERMKMNSGSHSAPSYLIDHTVTAPAAESEANR